MSNSLDKSIAEEWQDRVKILLYIAAALRIGLVLLELFSLIPGASALSKGLSLLNFISGLCLIIFFVAEMILLPPVGMALMSILVSVVFFFLPYVVVLFLDLIIESVLLMFIAGLICYMLSGVYLTFVCGWLTSIEVIMVSGPLSIATGIGVAVAGSGAAVAYGTKAAIDKAGKSAGGRTMRALTTFLGSLLVFVVIGWPMLSATNSISGVLSCKPAVIAAQSFFNHINMLGSDKVSDDYKAFFDKEKDWVFENNFYSTCIDHGNNNIVQGEKNLIAGNETTLAVLLNGLLYVRDDTVTDAYNTAGYIPRKTDALVLDGSNAFVFGYNKVFVCGRKGQYTWKKTKWTSEFKKLSEDEQFERVYDILERQNTQEELKFPYDEVGVVAYAQRNGLLLGYDSESHMAVFASKAKKGEVTVYRQTEPGSREKLGTFTPTYISGKGMPYYLSMSERALAYLDGNEVKSIMLNSWKESTMFTHPESEGKPAEFTSIHHVDLGEEGQYLVYLDNQERLWLDTRDIGIMNVKGGSWNTDTTRISGFAGNFIYSIQYDDSLLSRLTYLKDTKENSRNLINVWTEAWNYQRIPLKRSLYDPVAAEQEEEQKRIEEEQKRMEEEARLNDPAVKYPSPEIASRKNRALYDKTYIVASNYSTYKGPQERFWFQYPTRFYDHVDYTLENDGADITIIFTCDNDPSYLEVSVHPLPDGVENIKSYAEEWRDREMAALYNGLENNFKEYDGDYRFRIQGWIAMNSGVQTHVICRVDGESIMKMVLRIPNGTDKEDSAVKEYYGKYMNYRCGFGIPTKAPSIK